jgi:5-methylcytosine-specific restriction endonuclease McrA
MVSKTNKRRAEKLKRTAPWADLKSIKEFYLNCPKGYHVDHIVPLQGTNVSGLHVLNNLQYLSATQNLIKGNKWI